MNNVNEKTLAYFNKVSKKLPNLEENILGEGEFVKGKTKLFDTEKEARTDARVQSIIEGKSFDDYTKTSLFSGAHIVSESQYPYVNKKNLATAYNTKLEPDSYKIKIPFLFVSDAYGLYDWFKRIDENSMISETSKMFLGKTANIVSEKSLQSPFGYLATAKDSTTQTIAVKEHSHDGSFGNFKTIARRFNDEKLSIIILTNQNTNNVFQISNDIYKLVAKKIK